MKRFKWQPNRITKLNEAKLRKKYLVPGRFKRYNYHEIPDDKTRGWVNAKLHERTADRIRKLRGIKPTPDLIRVYKRHGILVLSEVLDYPPWNLFVILTKHRRKSKYDRDQRRIAMYNDIQSPLMQKVGKKRADRFEERLIRFFRKQGVKLKDENDLAREQIKKYGRPRWTVDLWFADNPIVMNGKKIHWIECKNYMLTNNKLFLPSVKKQVQKYRKQWGPGAIAFSKGFNYRLREKDVLLLDAYEFKEKIKRVK